MEPTREETRLMRYALRHLAALAGEHLSAFDEIALGIDATFDAHLQRISQLERRLTDALELVEAMAARLDDQDEAIDLIKSRLGGTWY